MNLRKLWILFAQAVTVVLAALFVIALFRPGWLPWRPSVVTVREEQTPAQLQGTPSMLNFQAAARRAMPSVVNIYTASLVRSPLLGDPLLRRFFGGAPERVTSLGSGVVVSAQGYILTNNHVVDAADEIAVVLPDGRPFPARIVGTDPETDLAVLKATGGDFTAITFADSEKIGVGDAVLAIGNPFGVGQTVTFGIVSATGRSGLGINVFENFIQTDAAINPGNSGGALVDLSGRLVGINTAIFSETGGSLGIGFAIPSSLAKQVMEQIIAKGAVVRGWIGVDIRDLGPGYGPGPQTPAREGVLVVGVQRGGPADRADVHPGDVLLQLEGRPLASAADALNRIAALVPGRVATVSMRRNGTELTLKITVGRRPGLRPRSESFGVPPASEGTPWQGGEGGRGSMARKPGFQRGLL